MKNLYIIASAAAKNMESETQIWDELRQKGWNVSDIHEFPRICSHEIAVTTPAIAGVIKKRFSIIEKHVVIICLIPSINKLLKRLQGYPDAVVAEQYDTCSELAKISADICISSDDMESAAKELVSFIDAKEQDPISCKS